MSSTISTYATHDGAIDALVFGPDGALVSAARDGAIRRWGSDPALLCTAEGASYHVLSAGPMLVAGSTSGELVWIDWRSGAVVRREQAMDEGITCVCARGDGLVAVGGDSCSVRLYDASGRLVWAGETYKWPYAMCWSPDGERLIIATWDAYLYEVEMNDLPPGTVDEPYEIPYPDETPSAAMPFFDVLCVDHEKVALCNAGEDGEPSVFVARCGESDLVASFTCGAIHALARSPDGTLIAGGGNDGIVFVWDAQTLVERARFDLGEGLPAVAKGQDVVYPAYADYHEASGPGSIFSIAWHPAGGSLFVGTQGGSIVELRR